MFFSRYFSASLIWMANRRRRPARCLAAATSGSSNTSTVTASPASMSAGKPISVWPPLRISSSSGNSPKVQAVNRPSRMLGFATFSVAARADLAGARSRFGSTFCSVSSARCAGSALYGAERTAEPAPGDAFCASLSEASAWNAPRAWLPSSAFSAPRFRPCPICRPCSSTTRKFMKKWGVSMSTLMSAFTMSNDVASRTNLSTASTSPPVPNFSGAFKASANLVAVSGSGTSRLRGRWCRVLSSACTLSFSMPGTSHSQRSSFTWFSTNNGTVTVRPSRASPGSCKYVAAQSTPPRRIVLGNDAVVIPAASWRISSSRVSFSRSGCFFTSSRYQRSKL